MIIIVKTLSMYAMFNLWHHATYDQSFENMLLKNHNVKTAWLEWQEGCNGEREREREWERERESDGVEKLNKLIPVGQRHFWQLQF